MQPKFALVGLVRVSIQVDKVTKNFLRVIKIINQE